MIAQLEATTVSKVQLEASEDELKKVNAEMLWEISQRERAQQQTTSALREKEVLLREIHHRVKDNLAIISSLLDLQMVQIKDAEALSLFKTTQGRVRSIALIHEHLYKSRDLGRVDFNEYLQTLLSQLLHSYVVDPDLITLNTDIPEVSLNLDTAIPCCLVIQELIANALKHAFPNGRSGEIEIALDDASPNFLLVVRDNGVGLPQALDFRNTESLGLQLVTTLVDQLDGSMELRNGAGTEWRIQFSEVKQRGNGVAQHD